MKHPTLYLAGPMTGLPDDNRPVFNGAAALLREAHPDDEAVDRFASAMKAKLAAAHKKGRGGWEGCSQTDLSRMLREHVEKGDPCDVANFCLFLWSLEWGILPLPVQGPPTIPTTSVLIGQILVMADLLKSAIGVVRTIPGDTTEESDLLQTLVDQSEAAIATVLTEHAMPKGTGEAGSS